MQLKKGSYVYNQIAFGLMAMDCMMVNGIIIKETLEKHGLANACKEIKKAVSDEHKELVDFIFNELFSTEENTERIIEVFDSLPYVERKSLINNYRYRVEGEQSDYTNGCIESIASSILSLKKHNLRSVIDIGCGQGVFLAEAVRNMVGDTFYGIEINKNLANIAKLKMLIMGQTSENVVAEDIFDRSYVDNSVKRYDGVFCHAPIGMKMAPDKLVDCGLFNKFDAAQICKRDSDWAFVKAMEKMLKPDGKGIAVVRAGLLFTENGKQYRRELVEKGLLEAVILLPPNLLYNTGIQVALLVLSKKNAQVKMIDATGCFVKGRRVNTISAEQMDLIINLYLEDGSFKDYADDSDRLEELRSEFVLVDRKDIAENDYSFEPTNYILKETVSFDNERKLADGTNRIFRGVQIKAEEHDSLLEMYIDEPNCSLLNLSDISNGYINDSLEKVHFDDLSRYEKYMLAEGDVVLSARGTKLSIAVADNIEDRKIIVTGNLIVIRCNESLNPYYLKAFFESNDGRAMLKSAQTGSTIFAINPKQLQNLSFEAATLETQMIVAERMKWMIGELRDSYKRIASIKQKINHTYDESKEVQYASGL